MSIGLITNPLLLKFAAAASLPGPRLLLLSLSTVASEYDECFKPQIGLEIHAQLNSSAKLFSSAVSPLCSTLPSNSFVSAFDLAIPGTLPTLNHKCVEQCLLTAVLLDCEIADICRFDRKHYFYPDLPLGYQITQKACPIARNGHFNFYAQNEKSSTNVYEKRVRIKQLQLEMDSGKTLRADEVSANDLVDLNRAGVGLVEIVTEPDLANAFEASLFVEQLRQLLAHNGICSGQFHEGQIRVDVNVSVSTGGGEVPGKRTELKNLSSLSLMSAAIDNELGRQMTILKHGGEITEETRATNSRGITTAARAKGDDIVDYRFIPEPNLPSLSIDPAWVADAQRCAKRELFFHRCIAEFGFPPMFAIEVVNDPKMDTFIRRYVSFDKMVPYSRFCEWLRELRFVCDRINVEFPPSDQAFVHHFAELIALNEQKRVTKLSCIELLKELGTSDQSQKQQQRQPLHELISDRQLWQISDPDQIRSTIQHVFEQNPDAVHKARTNPAGRHFVRLRRAVVVMSNKRIDPVDIDRTMSDILGKKI